MQDLPGSAQLLWCSEVKHMWPSVTMNLKPWSTLSKAPPVCRLKGVYPERLGVVLQVHAGGDPAVGWHLAAQQRLVEAPAFDTLQDLQTPRLHDLIDEPQATPLVVLQGRAQQKPHDVPLRLQAQTWAALQVVMHCCFHGDKLSWRRTTRMLWQESASSARVSGSGSLSATTNRLFEVLNGSFITPVAKWDQSLSDCFPRSFFMVLNNIKPCYMVFHKAQYLIQYWFFCATAPLVRLSAAL